MVNFVSADTNADAGWPSGRVNISTRSWRAVQDRQQPTHRSAGGAAVGEVDARAIRTDRAGRVAVEHARHQAATVAGFVGEPDGVDAGQADGSFRPVAFRAGHDTTANTGHLGGQVARHAPVYTVRTRRGHRRPLPTVGT
jgi:hypothetical protein